MVLSNICLSFFHIDPNYGVLHNFYFQDVCTTYIYMFVVVYIQPQKIDHILWLRLERGGGEEGSGSTSVVFVS